jgi:hypothetical protein
MREADDALKNCSLEILLGPYSLLQSVSVKICMLNIWKAKMILHCNVDLDLDRNYK